MVRRRCIGDDLSGPINIDSGSERGIDIERRAVRGGIGLRRCHFNLL